MKLPDIIIVRSIEKSRKELILSFENGAWVKGKSYAENLSSTTTYSFFSCQTFSPPPDVVGHGGMTRVEVIAPPPPDYGSRDPLFTRENLLWESPVGLSSRSAYACISRANLAGWTVCPLGILTDECKLNYLAFFIPVGLLALCTKYISIWSHFEQQEKAFSGVKSRILYSIYNLQKVRAWLCFVSHHPEKQTNKLKPM